MKKELRILLADDQERVRYSLRVLLSQQPGWMVIGEAETAEHLLALASVLNPDLVLLDWNLPDMPGETVLVSLHRLNPDLPTIVLSGKIEVKDAAFEAGADHFFCKTNPPNRLIGTIRLVQGKRMEEQ